MLQLIKNEQKYWEFIRTLRNNDQIKHGFIDQNYITKEEQELYMTKYNDCFYICLENNVPVGYIGVINNDIRIATNPNYQQKGIGLFMVNKIKEINPQAFAKVKIENEASLKLFQKAGFKIKYYILEQD